MKFKADLAEQDDQTRGIVFRFEAETEDEAIKIASNHPEVQNDTRFVYQIMNEENHCVFDFFNGKCGCK